MKLTAFLLFVGLLQVGAKTFAQKITLTEKNAPLNQVFEKISAQTGFDFLYSTSMLNAAKPVNIHIKNAELKDVLNELFSHQPLNYTVTNKSIVVSKKQILPVTQIAIPITGAVVDTLGVGLPGVSVSVKGSSSTGTVTDKDGYFSLSVPENAIIVVSMIGYTTQEIPIGKLRILRVLLKETSSQLGDVVVVAYGTQKKVSVTGAIASVSSRELRQSPVANLTTALAGRLPGLTTIQNSGEPGADGAALTIRGFGTYNGGAQAPLVLVDGIERSFSGIDPNEIENISILKDASSTALYGVRGANGVILVTTRKGTIGKAEVSFTMQSGLQSPTRLPEYLDSFDALTLYSQGLVNDGQNVGQYTPDYIAKFKDNNANPAYKYLYPDVDWYKTLLKPNSAMSSINLNVNGGTESAQYFISLSYLNQNGLYNFSNVNDYNVQAVTNKYNFRSNVNVRITKDLSVRVNLATVITDRNYPGNSASSIFSAIQNTPRWYYPVTNPNGSIAERPNSNASPYALLTQTGYQQNLDNSATSSTELNLKMPWVTDGLSFNTRLSFDEESYRNVSRTKGYNSFIYSLTPDTDPNLNDGTYANVSTGASPLNYGVNGNSITNTVLETSLNYSRSFHKHSVTGLALYQQAEKFLDVAGGSNGNDASQAIAGLPYKRQGLVGRVTDTYDSKYTLEFDAGYTGSENFPPGKRFGFFPAASLGWIISDENFIKNSPGLSFINLLKLRGSAGYVGNDQGIPRFIYLSTYTLGGAGYTFGQNNNNGFGGTTVSATGNPNVTWERAGKINLGLDMSLWNDKLDITADVFKEHRTNILTTPLTIPDFIGITQLPIINAGIVNNKGYEVSVTHKNNFNSKQGYFIRFNYSYNKDKIINVDEPAFPANEQFQAKKGTQVGEDYGLTAIGLFKNAADIANSPSQSAFGNVQPGDIKYLDRNHDGRIDSQDAGYLNTINHPNQYLGLGLGYHFGGFDASVLFQGAFGGSLYLNGNGYWPFQRFGGALAIVQNNYWTPNNLNAMFPRISALTNPNNYQPSSFWMYSSNYVRLKNAELGFTFPNNWVKKVGLKTARLYVNGLNLITWTKIKTFDPEIADGSGTYPQQKVFNLGLNITL